MHTGRVPLVSSVAIVALIALTGGCRDASPTLALHVSEVGVDHSGRVYLVTDVGRVHQGLPGLRRVAVARLEDRARTFIGAGLESGDTICILPQGDGRKLFFSGDGQTFIGASALDPWGKEIFVTEQTLRTQHDQLGRTVVVDGATIRMYDATLQKMSSGLENADLIRIRNRLITLFTDQVQREGTIARHFQTAVLSLLNESIALQGLDCDGRIALLERMSKR